MPCVVRVPDRCSGAACGTSTTLVFLADFSSRSRYTARGRKKKQQQRKGEGTADWLRCLTSGVRRLLSSSRRVLPQRRRRVAACPPTLRHVGPHRHPQIPQTRRPQRRRRQQQQRACWGTQRKARSLWPRRRLRSRCSRLWTTTMPSRLTSRAPSARLARGGTNESVAWLVG